MYRSLFSLSPQDHKMEKDGFHTLPPPKRHHLLLLFQTHLLSLRKNEPIPARKRPLPPPPPTVFLRRSASGLPTLSSPLSTPPPRTNPRLTRQRDSPATAALPDLNEDEAPDEDHPVLEKTEDTCGVEEEEEDGIVCCICSSTDGDPSDPIVFCDGCDLTVHATCYGDPLVRAVPDGDWFCRRCDLPREDGEKSVSTDCFLCPTKVGATKPAVDGRWAHIACSLLVLEVLFKDAEGREGIDCSHVPCRRCEAVCYICNTTNECVIDCSQPKCSLVFHVGCGLKGDLRMECREGRGGAVVAGFCKVHTLLWLKQQQTGKFKIVPREHKRKKM